MPQALQRDRGGHACVELLTKFLPRMPDPQNPDLDGDLVARAREGDMYAFDLLVHRHRDRLHGLIYRMTLHREDTCDLLQEVFVRAYRGLPDFLGRASFSTWLHRIAVNMTLKFLNQQKRLRMLSLEDLAGCPQIESTWVDTAAGANPERQSSLLELQQGLDEAMRRLSEAHRVVVMMFDVQGVSHAEIAGLLQVSEGTVRSRLHYAHQQLQGHLEGLRD